MSPIQNLVCLTFILKFVSKHKLKLTDIYLEKENKIRTKLIINEIEYNLSYLVSELLENKFLKTLTVFITHTPQHTIMLSQIDAHLFFKGLGVDVHFPIYIYNLINVLFCKFWITLWQVEQQFTSILTSQLFTIIYYFSIIYYIYI